MLKWQQSYIQDHHASWVKHCHPLSLQDRNANFTWCCSLQTLSELELETTTVTGFPHTHTHTHGHLIDLFADPLGSSPSGSDAPHYHQLALICPSEEQAIFTPVHSPGDCNVTWNYKSSDFDSVAADRRATGKKNMCYNVMEILFFSCLPSFFWLHAAKMRSS